MRPLGWNKGGSMKHASVIFACVLALGLCGLSSGCARSARNTEGFAVVDTVTVDAPFMETWQAVKSALRDEGFDIYTRDKRGLFVAYSEKKRRRLVPRRVQYTITLEPVDTDCTRVFVETLDQVYGVTLLTYPGWHDRKTTDSAKAKGLLDTVQARLAVPSEDSGPA